MAENLSYVQSHKYNKFYLLFITDRDDTDTRLHNLWSDNHAYVTFGTYNLWR